MIKTHLFLLPLMALFVTTITHTSQASDNAQALAKIKFQIKSPPVKITVTPDDISLKITDALLVKKLLLSTFFKEPTDQEVKESSLTLHIGQEEWKNNTSLADVRASLVANNNIVESKHGPASSAFKSFVIGGGMIHKNFSDDSDDDMSNLKVSDLE